MSTVPILIAEDDQVLADGLLRLSVGIEDLADLKADLERAFALTVPGK